MPLKLMSVKLILSSIERTLSLHAPELLQGAGLRPPASTEARKLLAQAFGEARLSDDVDGLFSWHDGQSGSVSILEEGTDLGGWLILESGVALETLSHLREVNPAGWRDAYLPILDSGDGDYGVVDVRSGELWTWHHDGDAPYRVAESLWVFFQWHDVGWKSAFPARQ